MTDLSEINEGLQRERKPRVALMGEFSAGKSTLTNILLGGDALPTKVTATRLPPVWISHGEEGAWLVAHDGTEEEFDLADLDKVDLDATRLIRLQLECETLLLCDLIDMPGISDPNMPAEVWQSVFDAADCVVWCTHATQAWRQSEAATWEMIREGTNGDNLLLVTQFDKLVTDRDRARVLARIRKETEGQFSAVYPVSLLKALNAGDDVEVWAESGAAKFTEHLIELLLNPSSLPGGEITWAEPVAEEDADDYEVEAEDDHDDDIAYADIPHGSPLARQIEAQTLRSDLGADAPAPDAGAPRVIPKRVRASGGARPDRLPPDSVGQALNAGL